MDVNRERLIRFCDEAGITESGGMDDALFQGSYDEIKKLILIAMSEAYRQSAQLAFQMGWDRCNNDEYQCACAELEDGIKKLNSRVTRQI